MVTVAMSQLRPVATVKWVCVATVQPHGYHPVLILLFLNTLSKIIDIVTIVYIHDRYPKFCLKPKDPIMPGTRTSC
jgi:hypothetical protein